MFLSFMCAMPIGALESWTGRNAGGQPRTRRAAVALDPLAAARLRPVALLLLGLLQTGERSRERPRVSNFARHAVSLLYSALLALLRVLLYSY